MGWRLGYDGNWSRDIGYGVPAMCDFPGCNKKIDRGLAYVCGSEPYGGSRGCGLYFCQEHLIMHARLPQLCKRCHDRKDPFPAKQDHPEWVRFKLKDKSWADWRKENLEEVKRMKANLLKK